MKSKITIEMPATEAQRFAIYRMRYETYVEELGWNSRYADHNLRILSDPLDAHANLFGAFVDGRALATIRTNYGRNSDLTPYTLLYEIQDSDLNAIAVTSFFMVRTAYRRSRLALEMVQAAFELGRMDGIRSTFIDCEPALVNFYLKFGFRMHRDRIVHPDFGPGACMLLDTEDFPFTLALAG